MRCKDESISVYCDASVVLVPHCTIRQHPFVEEYRKRSNKTMRLNKRMARFLKKWEIATLCHGFTSQEHMSWLSPIFTGSVKNLSGLSRQNLGVLYGRVDELLSQRIGEDMRANPLFHAPPEGEPFQHVLERVKHVVPVIVRLLDSQRGPVLIISPISVLLALRICLENISDVEAFLKRLVASDPCHRHKNTLYAYSDSVFELLGYNVNPA